MRIDRFVSAFNIALPPPALVFGGQDIRAHYAVASSGTPTGQPDVDLQLNFQHYGLINAPFCGSTTNARLLNEALARLLAARGGGQNAIGLIVADMFAQRPGLFGLMFAQAFFPETALVSNRPRTGAAVFVEAIAERRKFIF